jgi:hypothetical protein
LYEEEKGVGEKKKKEKTRHRRQQGYQICTTSSNLPKDPYKSSQNNRTVTCPDTNHARCYLTSTSSPSSKILPPQESKRWPVAFYFLKKREKTHSNCNFTFRKNFLLPFKICFFSATWILSKDKPNISLSSSSSSPPPPPSSFFFSFSFLSPLLSSYFLFLNP